MQKSLKKLRMRVQEQRQQFCCFQEEYVSSSANDGINGCAFDCETHSDPMKNLLWHSQKSVSDHFAVDFLQGVFCIHEVGVDFDPC